MLSVTILLVAAIYGCTDAHGQYYATSYANPGGYAAQASTGRYYWPNSYRYKQPTTTYQYKPSTTTNTANTVASGGSGPWWRSYFPGASLPGEREIFPEWFEVDEADQCDDVPDSVNTGKPRDLCGDDDLGSRFCICMKRPRYGSLGGHVAGVAPAVYEPICGECRDPCALRFIPDSYPRKNRDDSFEDDNNNDNDNGARRNRN